MREEVEQDEVDLEKEILFCGRRLLNVSLKSLKKKTFRMDWVQGQSQNE
jgi:hypothetical protein